MARGHSREEAESIAMAQYADDCLIFANIDGMLEVKKEFPEMMMQLGIPNMIK
jgi:hypothetical protein